MDLAALYRQTFGDIPSDIRFFELSSVQTNVPNVGVTVNIRADILQLCYFVAKSDLPVLDCAQIQRQDYLWKNDCLECFFDFGEDAYFELNASLTGAYNLYEFSSYRTPNTLPPSWSNGSVSILQSECNEHTVRHISIQLSPARPMTITKINPTVILYIDGEPCFYAINHASPPDFHDKNYWQVFESSI